MNYYEQRSIKCMSWRTWGCLQQKQNFDAEHRTNVSHGSFRQIDILNFTLTNSFTNFILSASHCRWTGFNWVAAECRCFLSPSLPNIRWSTDKYNWLACAWQTVRDKCFSKCVTKPSSSLSGGESSCISRCVERYIEATGIISRAVISSLPR